MINRIYIGQTPWRIRWTSDIPDFGVTDHMKATILVNAEQHVDQARETVLHEIIHAICFAYGVPVGDTEAEEAIIKTLSPALLDVLCNNPHLVEFLTEEKDNVQD